MNKWQFFIWPCLLSSSYFIESKIKRKKKNKKIKTFLFKKEYFLCFVFITKMIVKHNNKNSTAGLIHMKLVYKGKKN